MGSPAAADRVFESITRWIEKHLRLPINREKSDTGHPWNRQFLGYQITNRLTLRPSPKSINRFKEKVREVFNARAPATSTQLRDRWLPVVRGWSQYYKIADEPGWTRELSGWLRRHIRKCFWQRWHSAQGRQRRMLQLGAHPKSVARCNLWGGAWPSAKHPAMHTALSNRTLKHYGFLTPADFVPA